MALVPATRNPPSSWARRIAIVLALVSTQAQGRICQGADEARQAQALLLSGKYEEAAEAFSALAEADPVAAAVGMARTKASTGKRDEVAAGLKAALEKHPQAAPLHAEQARWALERGDLDAAAKASAAAIELDDEQLLGRWVRAEFDCQAGRLDEAAAGYKWFVDYYNDHEVTAAESLGWIGLASAQYARWTRLTDQFTFLVNELYPDALKIAPEWWPAHYYAGLLYLEKYNQAEAAREFKAALKLNPNSAEIHAAIARLAVQNFDLGSAQQSVERALEINPVDLDAQLTRADILLANFQAAAAIPLLEETCRVHPASEAARGRLAAACAIVDGLPADLAGTRVGSFIEQAVQRNPHCGEFFLSLAAALDLSRKYPAAMRYFREASARMPQLVEPYGELGVVLMRLGEEADARQQLDKAFQIDPFNVRVNNMLKVLEVLDGYAVLETEHFVIKFDRARDEILARYASAYLEEEVYPELCRKFGYEPEGKSLFEIFNRARNTNGHGWFSARMVGLPFVHTVGACAGKIVALASPNDMPKKFNWARVLKHEFVHVLNLQQTDFSVPHWFTEALAVGSEGAGRPQAWGELLADRVPKNKLFTLDTINLGFVRPGSSDDWQMAYCQADLYARYMTKTYGENALAKMLAAYGENLDTAHALRREFAVDQPEFERGYLDFVRAEVAGLGARSAQSAETLAELERAHRQRPDDAGAAARLAVAYLARKDYPRARELAEGAMADPAARQTAAYVLARVRLVVGETRQALALLEENVDQENPDDKLLNLLAGLKYKAEDYPAAATLYEIGARRYAGDIGWIRSLAKVYLAQGNDAKLAEALVRLAEIDPDDLPVRKKLAQLALAAGDFPTAVRWAREAVYIDCMEVEIHRMLAEGYGGQRQFGRAADEYEVAVQLDGKQPALQLALAEACLKAERPARARTALQALLALEPDHAAAAKLLESLAP